MKRLALVVLACSGCDLLTESFATNDFSGDPFPIYVDTRSGGVLLGLESQGRRHIAVLDVLSPLTLIDPGANAKATIDLEDLTLLGDRAPDLGMPDLPRAAFDQQQVLRLHPCATDEDICKLGVANRVEQEFDAIVGADSLAGDALRMRLGANEVFVLANVGGEDRDRTYACDAVFPAPYRGGGTLIVADTEVPFAGRRPTVQACLSPDPDSFKTQAARGTDALFVMSTSIGPSLLSESAYERYRDTHPGALPLSMITEVQISLPSGPINGRPIMIDKLALVARANSQPLAPCRQVYAHKLLSERDCFSDNVEDCPCEGDGQTFCPVPASVGIDRSMAGSLEMLVVPDDNATLQALRTEFRPSSQEIDGLLGTSAMKDIEVDIDYTHNRLLMRCSSPAPLCETRPALEEKGDRKQVRGCLGPPN